MKPSLQSTVESILASRAELVTRVTVPRQKSEGEGGCGVLGVAANVPIAGRHLLRPMRQMCNRGNGKGGGIAAVGLDPAQFGVDAQTMRERYLVQLAYLDPKARSEVERELLEPAYEMTGVSEAPCVGDPKQIAGLEVKPPQVVRYFARPRPQALADFRAAAKLSELSPEELADEFVYQTSYRLNQAYYASLGEKRAFVVSHGKDMMVLKIVGFAEQAIEYYKLEDVTAHVWIGHQRYPTKGRVWHPGGAHPFVGLHEALVHNGDFANYASICEYLAQRNLRPLFLTDTEVAVLLFDLWSRVYRYPLEYVIESMAPTTERDFDQLPEEKRRIYRALQLAHIHGSPDGPWFFIVARNETKTKRLELLGITDTSMLRPQVFALHGGDVQIGAIGSERQAIDAFLSELAAVDPRVCPVADRYWNARGGSHTDGGAFAFSVERNDRGATLSCADKFGKPVIVQRLATRRHRSPTVSSGPLLDELLAEPHGEVAFLRWVAELIAEWTRKDFESFLEQAIRAAAAGELQRSRIVDGLSLVLDRPFDAGEIGRNWIVHLLEQALGRIFDAVPESGPGSRRLGFGSRSQLSAPSDPAHETLHVDATGFPAEGEQSLALFLVAAHKAGWHRLVIYRTSGQRFLGSGLGPDTRGVRIDVFGRAGDYLGSGLDGAEVLVHGSGQDQLGQILKAGRLVIRGDVGQAFMYGAKGGRVFVRGNAAGRPLINAVGSPRVVINGTCLDYLAESFMAGDPLAGGGFVVLNGVRHDSSGQLEPLDSPYPGSNLFSLASGGALYVRDPEGKVEESQLNGGCFARLADADWAIVRPLLEENERLLGIPVDELLTHRGGRLDPARVYRKIAPVRLRALEGV